MQDFKIVSVAEKDGTWYAIGESDGRLLQLPITDEERQQFEPHLEDGRTYTTQFEEERVVRDAEMLVAAGEAATA